MTKTDSKKYWEEYKTRPEYREAHCRAARRWSKEHPKKVKEIRARYYQKHKERLNEQHRLWVARHPGYYSRKEARNAEVAAKVE